MKHLIWILTGFSLLFGCKTHKINVTENWEIKKPLKPESPGLKVIQYVRVMPDKNLEIQTDETKKHYVVIDDGSKIVIQLGKSISPKDTTLMDANIEYSLTFEVENPITEKKWSGEELKQIKATYGFHAFHPQAGYYPVSAGEIYIKPEKNKLIIEVNLPEKTGGKYINGTYEAPIPEKNK